MDEVRQDVGWRRIPDAIERFLGSRLLSLAAFAVISKKLLEAAGFQFDELVLVMILYINFSTKLEEIHQRLSHPTPPTGDDNV